jgi:hypothetical protein
MFEEAPFLYRLAFANIMIVAVAQLFRPVLAWKIKKRFAELGVVMRSSVGFSLFNFSFFWGEARRLQETGQDAEVARYLKYNRWFWIYAIFSFLFVVIAGSMR